MLAKTLESIANMGNSSYVIVINDRVEHNQFIWEQFFKLFAKEGHKVSHCPNRNKTREGGKVGGRIFRHAENGWIYTVNSGDVVPCLF